MSNRSAEDAPRSVQDLGKRPVPWRDDPFILQRLETVERLHLRGASNREIARQCHVDPKTIAIDLDRLRELWLERTSGTVEELKAKTVAQLSEVLKLALHQAEFDEQVEDDIIYGRSDDAAMIQRSERGPGPSFHGAKSASANVARQAAMDIAKILGLLVDRQEVKGEHLVREYVGVDIDKVLGKSDAGKSDA